MKMTLRGVAMDRQTDTSESTRAGETEGLGLGVESQTPHVCVCISTECPRIPRPRMVFYFLVYSYERSLVLEPRSRIKLAKRRLQTDQIIRI